VFSRQGEATEVGCVPSVPLLEDLLQVLGRLASRYDGCVEAHTPAGGGKLEREQVVLCDALGREPAHLVRGKRERREDKGGVGVRV
jgi:hypothetical protein